MDKVKALCCSISAFALLAIPAQGQNYPEFDGVYVWDRESGEWWEVPNRTPLRVQIGSSENQPQESWLRFENFNGWYQIRGYDQIAVAEAPVIDDSDGIRILVKSRNPQLVFMAGLTDKFWLRDTIPPGNMLNSAAINDNGGGQLSDRPETQQAIYVETGFGWFANAFKSKTVDQYTTEYLLADLPAGLSFEGLSSCNACDLPVLAFSVQTPSSFHVFTTKDIYEWQSLGD